jgi:hypothetical protein
MQVDLAWQLARERPRRAAGEGEAGGHRRTADHQRYEDDPNRTPPWRRKPETTRSPRHRDSAGAAASRPTRRRQLPPPPGARTTQPLPHVDASRETDCLSPRNHPQHRSRAGDTPMRSSHCERPLRSSSRMKSGRPLLPYRVLTVPARTAPFRPTRRSALAGIKQAHDRPGLFLACESERVGGSAARAAAGVPRR